MNRMDLKTLEYMKERVNKSTAIITRIEELTEEIARAKKTFNINMYHPRLGGREDFILLPNGEGKNKACNGHRAETIARMLNVFIDMTLLEIKRLEMELEKI